MCLRAGIVAAIGVALNNISLRMSLVLSIGSVFDYYNQKRSEHENNDE